MFSSGESARLSWYLSAPSREPSSIDSETNGKNVSSQDNVDDFGSWFRAELIVPLQQLKGAVESLCRRQVVEVGEVGDTMLAFQNTRDTVALGTLKSVIADNTNLSAGA